MTYEEFVAKLDLVTEGTDPYHRLLYAVLQQYPEHLWPKVAKGLLDLYGDDCEAGFWVACYNAASNL